MGVDVRTVALIGVKLTGKDVIKKSFDWDDEAEDTIRASRLHVLTDSMCGKYCYIGIQLVNVDSYTEELQEKFHEEYITRTFLEVGEELRDLEMPDIIREAVEKEDIQLHIFTEYS